MPRREKQEKPEATASQRMTRQQTRRSGDGADAEKTPKPAVDNSPSMDYAPYRATRSAQARAAELQNLRHVRNSPTRHYQRLEAESPMYTRLAPEEKELESTDMSTDNGESSGNSQETQQWSDTDTRPSSAELGGGNQLEVPCRVTWCERLGQRYGLCWAHGGVKKCCHYNCEKIALTTGEFCAIHEREIRAY